MDSNGKDINSGKIDVKNKPLTDVDSKTSLLTVDRKEEHETASLLPPRRGGLSKKLEKQQRKVMWNDNYGNKLAEVLEFQPRRNRLAAKYIPTIGERGRESPCDASDSDDDENSDSCICRIM